MDDLEAAEILEEQVRYVEGNGYPKEAEALTHAAKALRERAAAEPVGAIGEQHTLQIVGPGVNVPAGVHKVAHLFRDLPLGAPLYTAPPSSTPDCDTLLGGGDA